MEIGSTYTERGSGGQDFGAFSIVPQAYESRLNNRYGVNIGEMGDVRKTRLSKKLGEYVFFKTDHDNSKKVIKKRILERFANVPGFCSMNVADNDDLMRHVEKIHELSYLHYIWGKETIRDRFPKFYCDLSSRNLALTLMDNGYPNSTFLYNRGQNHAYVGLPFLLREKQQRGFIIVDPTSDQLFKNNAIAPRNNLFVVTGDRWEYKTDWNDGADLYPNSGDDSVFANLHTLRQFCGNLQPKNKDIKRYFREVFKYPVDVE